MGIGSNEYKRLQNQLGWSSVLAAKFFKVNVSTITRWRNGSRPAPHSAVMCLQSVKSKKALEEPD